jgi:hypothetical protein
MGRGSLAQAQFIVEKPHRGLTVCSVILSRLLLAVEPGRDVRMPRALCAANNRT